MFVTRVITSKNCPKCKFYTKVLSMQKYEYEIYDADLDENSEQLDKWKITSMPVVQIVEHQDNGDSVVMHQFVPGQISTRAIETKKSMIAKQLKK